MNRRIILLFFICTLFALQVRATIPLVLEQTLQLPPCTSWDVQHWMDETSFGYAYLRADTVYWEAHVGDAVQAFKIPDSVYTPSMYDPFGYDWVQVIRHPSAVNNPCVLVTSHAWDIYGDYAYIFVAGFDMEANQALGMSRFQQESSDYCEWVHYELHDLMPWPSPPMISTNLLLVHWSHGEFSCTGNSYWWEDGNVWLTSLASGLSFQHPFDGTMIRPFVNTNSPRFAIYYYTWEDWESHFYPYEHTHTEHHEMRTYQPSTGSSTVVVDGNLNAVWAQTDGGGTQRLVVDYRDGTRALNPDTYDTLWYVPQHIGGEVARFAGSADERILHGNAVYDASNGAYLDQLGSMLGSLRNIIRSPTRNSDFVTYDNNTRTVRVYTSLPPVPKGLTCTFIPGTGSVRLRWQESPGATRYLIYVSSSASIEPWPMASVPAGTLTYDAEISQEHMFFQVTAEYGQ